MEGKDSWVEEYRLKIIKEEKRGCLVSGVPTGLGQFNPSRLHQIVQEPRSRAHNN